MGLNPNHPAFAGLRDLQRRFIWRHLISPNLIAHDARSDGEANASKGSSFASIFIASMPIGNRFPNRSSVCSIRISIEWITIWRIC